MKECIFYINRQPNDIYTKKMDIRLCISFFQKITNLTRTTDLVLVRPVVRSHPLGPNHPRGCPPLQGFLPTPSPCHHTKTSLSQVYLPHRCTRYIFLNFQFVFSLFFCMFFKKQLSNLNYELGYLYIKVKEKWPYLLYFQFPGLLNSMSSLPFGNSVKFELMQKFLSDIPGGKPAENSSTPSFENTPKNLSNPLQILTESVNPPTHFPKTENPPNMADNPLFSAALAQLARETESNKSRNLDLANSRNLSPAFLQQAQEIIKT